MPGTPEQLAVCDSTAPVLKVMAGAGTGKTTTLRATAIRMRGQRVLYLAFNRSVKEEAQKRFPSNTRCMTAHGLAFAQIGKNYANKPDKLIGGSLRPFHLDGVIDNPYRGPLAALYASRICAMVHAFTTGAGAQLDGACLPLDLAPVENSRFDPEAMVAAARAAWKSMVDLEGKVPMVHDGYLKLFQNSDPRLSYDAIMLDEAQDTNPTVAAIVARQDHARRIYVGDPHQAIYSFRGASNAMDGVQADDTLMLTGSFRFGQAVADVANALLQAKGEKAMRLQGLGGPSKVGAITGPRAYLSRGNSALFSRAVAALEKSERFAFVGPVSGYRFDLLEQTHDLQLGRKPRDPFLACFESFEQLQEHADALSDMEWVARCRIVEKYKSRVPGLVRQINARAMNKPEGADVVMTTCHKAKGLEFKTVEMAGDFRDFFDEEAGQWMDIEAFDQAGMEEVNLQYVASTRARETLCVSDKLERFLEYREQLAQGITPTLPAPKGKAASKKKARRATKARKSK